MIMVYVLVFNGGDLVLVYSQANDTLGAGKFISMWHNSFIVKHIIDRGMYELEDNDGNALKEPRNGLYLKKYYS